MSRRDDDFLGAIGLLMTGFGLGVAIGTVLGVLFAPKSGRETRRELAFTGLRVADLKRLNKDSRFAKTIKHTAEGVEYTIEPNSDNYLRQIWPDAAKFNPDWTLN